MPNSHLYKVNLSGKEFHILGTAHNISLSVFAEPTTSFILGHSKLITESRDVFKPFSIDELGKLGFLASSPEECAFKKLSHDMKREVVSILSPYLEFKSMSLEIIDFLNLKGLGNLVLMSKYFKDGMDYEILRHYKSDHREWTGLETRESLSGYNPDFTMDKFLELLSLFDRSDEVYKFQRKIIGYLYLDKLEALEDEACIEEIEVRNKAWLAKIEESSDCIICVGYAHLYGKEGILKLLKDKGYNINKTINGDLWEEVSEEDLSDVRILTGSEFKDWILKTCEVENIVIPEELNASLVGEATDHPE